MGIKSREPDGFLSYWVDGDILTIKLAAWKVKLDVIGGNKTGVNFEQKIFHQAAPVDENLVPIIGQESTPRKGRVVRRQPQKRKK